MPKRTYSHPRPERGPEPTVTPPERLSVPEDLRLRSVRHGGPSDLEIWLRSRPRTAPNMSLRRYAELGDTLYQVQVESGFDPAVCQAVDDLLAAVAEAQQ